MATENSNTAILIQDLRETISTMDSLSEQYLGWIEALSGLVGSALDRDDKVRSGDIREAISLIRYLAADCGNTINVEAENSTRYGKGV